MGLRIASWSVAGSLDVTYAVGGVTIMAGGTAIGAT